MSSNPQTKLSPADFAKRVRGKNPGAYDDLDDTILTRRVLSKYPTYTDMVDLPDLDKPLDAATIQGEAKKHGLILTSGKRSPEHNAAVGGAKSSYHLTGNAFDFGGPPDKMRAFYDHMRDTYGGRMKEILHGEGDHRDHVHVAFGDDKTPSAVPAKSTIPPSRSFSWSGAKPAGTGATTTPTPEEARGGQPEEAGLAQPGARATHLAGMTPADQTARFAEGKRKRGWLIPGDDIKDATALDQRLKDLAQVRAGLMGRPEQERGPSLAVVDEKIRHLARVKNDLAKMEAARHQKPSDALRQQMHVREMPLPSEGDRPPDRAADLPWYLKGYAADVGAGAQEGITGLGDAILGIEKMFGVKPSAEFEPALETGHELAQSTTERGGKGIGHEVVRGLTAMGVQLPALATGGTPMLALVGAAQAAAKPDARPEDVARGAATMALMGKILHQSGGLTMPRRILTGMATGAGVGAIEGGSREQVIAQALLFGGLGAVGGKGSKVQGRDGRTYEVTGEQGEQVTLKPAGETKRSTFNPGETVYDAQGNPVEVTGMVANGNVRVKTASGTAEMPADLFTEEAPSGIVDEVPEGARDVTPHKPLARAGSTAATELDSPVTASESAHPEPAPKTTAGHTLERVNQEGSKSFYSIVNPEGEHIGSVHVDVPEGSTVGRIDWMEAGALGGEENALGPKAVRDVLREIKREHPQLEEVEGLRHSGAKSRGAGPEQNVRMKLPREGDRRALDEGPPGTIADRRFEMQPDERQQVANAAEVFKTEPAEFGASNKIVTRADHAAALARLKARLKSPTLTSGLDPELIADAARVGAYYLEGGARSFAAWSARMVADLGDEIKPHLAEIWSAAQGHLKEAETEYTGLKKAVVAEERIERGADPIEAEAARTWGPLWEQTRREVGEGHVNPLGLARQVTETPRPMTDKEVTVLLHGKRRAQNQRYAAMDDMEAATGKGDRAARTDAEMRLERAETDMDAIEQASRAGMRENARGMSMMRAMVRDDYSLARLNQRARVAAGGDLKPEQGTRLREIGDRLDKAERGVGDIERHLEDYKRQEREYKQKSDPQRLAETKRRLHREIGELTRKLSSQDYVRDLKREGVSLDDEGLLLKKRRDELQREMGRKRKELEDLSGETERRESESRLKAYKTRVEKQIGDLLKQLATRDFAKKERKPLTLDEAAEALKERRDQLRKAADYEIKKIKYEARPVGQQIADRLSWYQRANLMSGAAGAARDVVSTGLWQTMDGLIFRPTRAAVEQVSAKLSGRQPEAYVGETGAALKGWMQGIGPGFREAVGTIARGYGPEAAARYDLPLMYEGPGGWKNPLNLVLRTRGALNELQRFMGVGAELAAEAYRQVRREGLTGAEARLRFEELRRNPTDEMVETAARHGERMTFTDKSDKVLNALYKVRELEIPRTGLRPGTFIFPFVRTTYNMMKRGLEMTPAGFAKLLKKDMSHLERADTIAKATLGSAFMTTLALTAEMAGAAPDDPANRARFYASGRQPWSIKVGGYWVPFKDLGPVGVPMAIVAAFKDKYAQGGGAFEPDLAKATAAAGRYTFVDQTAFRTVGSWYDALTGDPRSKGLSEIGGNFAQGFVPFSSALRTVAESKDAYLRNPQVWYEWVMEGLPGLRPRVPTHKTPIENKKQGLKALSPIIPTRDQGSYQPGGGSRNPFH